MDVEEAALIFDCPVGLLALVADDQGLRRISFGAHETDRHPPPRGSDHGRILFHAQVQLGEYFAGERREFDLPLSPEGTPFQRRVWEAVAEIPFGRTRSYAEIALRIGRPHAIRAVGAATGANPLPLVVPCHRVVGRDRRLVGFTGGLEVKRWLLEHEGHTVEGERLTAARRLALDF